MRLKTRILATCAMLATVQAAAAQDVEKIYTLMPNTALSGVLDPNMPDRKDIQKAWPKTPADPAKIKVGWSEITMGNPFFVEIAKGAQKTAEKYGFAFDLQVADGDLQRQCSHIDTFITNAMDVIVVDPTDTLGVSRCINRAVDAGIPVVTVGTVPESDARVLTTITPNPFANGFGAGEYIAKNAGKDTAITAAMIIGVVGNSTSESRLSGMISGIVHERMVELGLSAKKEDAMLRGFELFQKLKQGGSFEDAELKFNVVALGEGNWTEEGGLAAAEDILTAHASKLNYIFTDNDFMGLGAIRALRNIGKTGEIKVGAPSDGSREALAAVKRGDLLVTGPWSGEQTGVAAIEFVNNIFNKGLDASNLPMGSYFTSFTITPENVDEYIDPNPENKFYKYTITPVKSIPEIRADLATN
jgi:ribose transport system substrate-binding protein